MFRQTAAGILLLLFMAVYAIRGFHHHLEQTGSGKYDTFTISVAAATDCAVCDYHFAEDADAATAFAVLQLPLIYHSVCPSYLYPATTSVGLPGTDRGPPGFLKTNC